MPSLSESSYFSSGITILSDIGMDCAKRTLYIVSLNRPLLSSVSSKLMLFVTKGVADGVWLLVMVSVPSKVAVCRLSLSSSVLHAAQAARASRIRSFFIVLLSL